MFIFLVVLLRCLCCFDCNEWFISSFYATKCASLCLTLSLFLPSFSSFFRVNSALCSAIRHFGQKEMNESKVLKMKREMDRERERERERETWLEWNENSKQGILLKRKKCFKVSETEWRWKRRAMNLFFFTSIRVFTVFDTDETTREFILGKRSNSHPHSLINYEMIEINSIL